MIKEHAAAIFALLDAQASLTIHDGHVPTVGDPPVPVSFPYSVLYTDAGRRSASSLALPSSELRMVAQVTSVGLTADSVRVIQDKVATALLDVTPVVIGRACGPMSLINTRPAIEDRDVTLNGGAHPMYAVDEYQLITVPA